MHNALLLIGRLPLLAVMLVFIADGCDAKTAIGPRSTTKREIDALPGMTAKTGTTAPATTAGSALPAASQTATTPAQTTAPTPFINLGPNVTPPSGVVPPARRIGPGTATAGPARDPVIELSSPTVVQTSEFVYKVRVHYQFIEGAPNPDKDYMIQINFAGVRKPEKYQTPGSILQSEGELSFSTVPDVNVRSRIPLSTFTMAMGESKGAFSTSPYGYQNRSNIVGGRIDFGNGR